MKLFVLRMLAFAFILSFGAPPWAQSVTDASARPERGRIVDAVKTLGHADYVRREAAQKKLQAWSEDFPRYIIIRLTAAYREAEDLEVRHRLKEILRPLVRRHLVNHSDGFMGVRLQEVTLPDGTPAISLARVLPGLGADRAGLEDGDVVLELDGVPIGEVGGVQGFSERVAARLPGSLLDLVVLRDNKQFLITVSLVRRSENLFPRDRHPSVEKELDQWFLSIDSSGEADPDFPVGHFPMD